jgi:hypothetical protein
MSKFLLNLLLQISKALVNLKIQFLNQKSFFLAFGPANLAAHSASGPASPLAAPSPQTKIVPAGPSNPHVSRVFAENMFSFLVHAFTSQLSLPRLSDTGPRLSDVSSPPRWPTPVAFFRPLRPPRAARPPTS